MIARVKRVAAAYAHPDAPVVPIADLALMVDWGDDYQTLDDSLDREGMRNPVLAFRDGGRIRVKFGNQRVAWARKRGYTHIAAVVLDSEAECCGWLRFYRDA